MANNKETKRFKRKKSLIYGLFFVVMGIVSIVGASVLAYDTQKQIENWVEVEGTIVDTYVWVEGVSEWGGSKSYKPHLKVIFLYEYSGKTHQDTLYLAFGKKDSRDAAEAYILDEVAKSYTIGLTQTLYVNPANPPQTTRTISFTSSVAVGIWGLVSTIIGLIVWKFHLQ